MKTISNNDLKEILRKHVLWLNDDPEGERANLRWADLSEADLSEADLRGVCLYKANLRGANLYKANLRGANLYKANLRWADLWGADLNRADLTEANLYKANLRWADLWGADLNRADLTEADLKEADLKGANLSEAKIDWPLICPEKGSFIGYKKCRGGLIVELEIPEDALRSSATTRKCRCSKAKVLSITNLDGSSADVSIASSTYDVAFVYKVGETVEVLNFNTDRWDECSAGIHFFITRQEAVDYA